ncbi:hypothetical protein [Streptomyces violaceusniger]|uniref:Uncharacterized protein n=1 Tax=Streptomyces violaceusniger (strain Tu 4113) TaxID=653045 RepID=G2P884_STRV4|nr:hypothetical protein [Streptomyces violaceusniger]AEM86080.1 hypothetical protein Strvi_6699 [Streptomyces violaceusniger Tu 4113]
MTSAIDRILARALLNPTPPIDFEAAEARLAIRHADPGGAPPRERPPQHAQRTSAAAGAAAPGVDERMAQDLHTLCEAIIARPDALTQLRDFLTRRILEPPGSRVLGCVLQLAGHEDHAQFWWQFAAGAGDPAAAYCLYLHHMALGEDGQAHAWLEWWHEQAGNDIPPVTDTVEDWAATDHEMAAALRILHGLKREQEVPPATTAVIHYVARAVDFTDDPDIDLPLPEPGFADRIEDLTAAETTTATVPSPDRAVLPERPRSGSPA